MAKNRVVKGSRRTMLVSESARIYITATHKALPIRRGPEQQWKVEETRSWEERPGRVRPHHVCPGMRQWSFLAKGYAKIQRNQKERTSFKHLPCPEDKTILRQHQWSNNLAHSILLFLLLEKQLKLAKTGDEVGNETETQGTERTGFPVFLISCFLLVARSHWESGHDTTLKIFFPIGVCVRVCV